MSTAEEVANRSLHLQSWTIYPIVQDQDDPANFPSQVVLQNISKQETRL